MSLAPLQFGVFLGPHHPLDENPTLALARDLELIELLDELDYNEAWIGEHHSGGFEIIPAPEVFIAAAAERYPTGLAPDDHVPLSVVDQARDGGWLRHFSCSLSMKPFLSNASR